ncbi:MAG: hypothetical protein KKG95_08120 [Candidatus Omnitrophica bacterium]|nr:hypothetical protein [Candidatus Omnitrophota bacterium]
MEAWEAPMWAVFMTLFMGAGAGLMAFVAMRYFAGGRAPRKFRGWIAEVERAAIEVIDADLNAALAKARLFELIGKMPDDFDPTAFLAANVAEGIHRAVLFEAERRGIVQEGTFIRVYGEALHRRMKEDTAPPESEPAAEPRWVGTELVEEEGKK